MLAPTKQKSVFIKTYGCQMNVYDSERMGEALGLAGFAPVRLPDGADMIILNTCHIREKAAEKVYSELGRLKKLKTAKADMIIGVAGCVAQAEGEEILRRAPYVDLVFGPQNFQALPQMLDDLYRQRQSGERVRLVYTDFPTDKKFSALHHTPRPITRRPSAFVTIQEGCDKFCTFCVVPYTRGVEVSRPVDEIAAEVKSLCAQGVCEITLLGQNVNAWRDKKTGMNFASLLHLLAEIKGLTRLRYTTSHPRDMDDELISAHAHLKELMPYLHLPVQSGSDGILKAMNRGHNRQDYLRLIEGIRIARPDIALSSDFIIGFPNESEADFEDTLALIREVNFAQSYSFKYSPRPGTPAAEEAGQIDEDIKSQRLQILQNLLRSQQIAFHKTQIGQTLPVLFEGRGKKAGQISGRSPYLQSVHVMGADALIGTIQPVRITQAHQNSLMGEI